MVRSRASTWCLLLTVMVAAHPRLSAAQEPASNAVEPASRAAVTPSRSTTPREAAATQPKKARARALATALVYASVLFIIMFAGILAIMRFTRRFRAAVLKPERKPTIYTDAWAMHKTPEEAADDDEPNDDESDDDEPPDDPPVR